MNQITQTNCNMKGKKVNIEKSNEESVQIPTENVQIPTENVQIPTEKEVIPTEKEVIPTEKEVIPTEKVIKATKKVSIPVKKVKPLPTIVEPKEPTRKAITVMFSIDEMEHLEPIIKNRINAGITMNNNHFVRQCIDYAINTEYFRNKHIDVLFATHDEKQPFQYKLLKDALFANKDTKLEVCK